VGHLGDGAEVHVVAEVRKEGAADSPKNALASLQVFLLGLLKCCLGSLSVDNLMVASKNVATGDVLKHRPSLQQKAPVWDLDCELAHIAQPHEEAREARFAVDRQEVEIVVEASESRADVVALKVRACGREEVRSLEHAAREDVLLEAHAYGSHFSGGEARLNHHVAPLIHALLPVRERRGDHLGDVISHLSWALANGPEEPPLSVELGRELAHWHVLRRQLVEHRLVVASALLSLWGDTCLEVELGLAIGEFLAGVKLA